MMLSYQENVNKVWAFSKVIVKGILRFYKGALR